VPDTFIKIASVTVGSGGASSMAFSSIPSTYTDLCVKLSMRAAAAAELHMRFNASSSGYSNLFLNGTGSSVSSGIYRTAEFYLGENEYGTYTANTFGNVEIYIPNYAGSNNKSISTDNVTETNATAAYASLIAGLWANTAAINSISITAGTSTFVQYSTATLYGISKS
jgi:hypothetical protein